MAQRRKGLSRPPDERKGMKDVSSSAIALMALMKLHGIGRRNALRIVNTPPNDPDPERYRDVFMARAEQARVPETELLEAWKRTLEELKKSAAAGIRAFSIHDPVYPARLREIPDPPAVLFVKGDQRALHGPKLIAIVGTREPTTYGETVARRSGKTAVEAGFTVVSGLAHGCDTLAHEGCLDGGGIGIAVMAHGLDKVYPAANRELAARLLDTGGCLVSEYPLGMAAARTSFAERDRIQSGLSDGVFVIETGIKGGTMHTVRFCRDQKRPLACVAHPEKLLTEEKTRGNQQMIADGWAAPVPDGPTLLAFLNGSVSAPSRKSLTHRLRANRRRRGRWRFDNDHLRLRPDACGHQSGRSIARRAQVEGCYGPGAAAKGLRRHQGLAEKNARTWPDARDCHEESGHGTQGVYPAAQVADRHRGGLPPGQKPETASRRVTPCHVAGGSVA